MAKEGEIIVRVEVDEVLAKIPELVAALRLARAADAAAEDRGVNDWSYDAGRWSEFRAALAAWRELAS